MVNDNQLPEVEKHEVQTPDLEKASEKKKYPYRQWLLFFTLLLSLGAITTSLIALQWLKHEVAHLKSSDAVFEANLKKFQQQLPELQYEIKNQQESVNEWLKKAKAAKIDWIKQEANYLVKQSTYQLKLANLEGATELLNDADNLLATTSFAEVEGAKQQLTKVISLLKTTQTVDRDGLTKQLDELKQAVNQLPLSVPESSPVPPTLQRGQENSGFWRPLNASWEQIRQMIIIRRHDKPVEPLVAPQQAVYLRQNLALQLEEASVAVLYRDSEFYRSTLAKVETWVKRFFDPQAKATQTFLQKVAQLAKVDIQTAPPDVFADLNAISNMLTAPSTE